jgi:phytol kinase
MLIQVWETFIQAVPDFNTVVYLGPPLILFTALGAWLAGYLRICKNVQTAYTRKIFHFYIFSAAGIIHLLYGLPEVVLFGSIVSLCVLYAVWRGADFPFYEALARPQDAPHRSFFILLPMLITLLGGVLANLLFGRLALVGYFVCGWGDAVGEPVGARWGRHRYRVLSLRGLPATRSWEGSGAVWLAGSVAAFFAVLAQGSPVPVSLGVGLLCGTVGASVEAVSTHGLDNLTIQLAAAGTAWYFLH